MQEKISQEELALLQKEIAERLKDIVYAHADLRARELLKKAEDSIMYIMDEDGEEEYRINFQVHMMAADFQQIIARARRLAEKLICTKRDDEAEESRIKQLINDDEKQGY